MHRFRRLQSLIDLAVVTALAAGLGTAIALPVARLIARLALWLVSTVPGA